MRLPSLILLGLLALLTDASTAAAAPLAPAMVASPSAPAMVLQGRGRARRSIPSNNNRRRQRPSGRARRGATASSNLSVFKTKPTTPSRRITDLVSGSSLSSRRPRRDGSSGIKPLEDSDLQTWFGTSDANGSGWVSYRESSHALGFDRSRFRSFDEDRDGRIDLDEFELYCLFAIRDKTFREPLPPADLLGAPKRSPEQLRIAYDRDRDGLLSIDEIGTALLDYGRQDLVPSRVVLGLDRDNDNRLDVRELSGIEGIVGLVTVGGLEEVPQVTASDARSAAELFLVIEPRAEGSNAPPTIQGPVRPFSRLDLNQDGSIDRGELEELLSPLFSTIRITTVLHTLDLNRDGVLSRTEFESSIAASENQPKEN